VAEIVFKNVNKRYGAGPEVIRDVSLTIPRGELCVFVGPSGCGKSTLLRMVAGLEDISSGELQIDGVRMNERAPTERGVAMVFQSYALYPHMTVYQNMAFGLKVGKQRAEVIDAKVRAAARTLQLEPLLDRLPKELSGGQRQRVAIGRAIVRHPRIFLFDEPLSNLDAELRVQMRLEIARLHRDTGSSSMIYVTHDQVEAMTLADRIVVLNTGDAVQRAGSVAQVGTPLQLYHFPANKFVAGFIGSPQMNFIPATLENATGMVARLRVGGAAVYASIDASDLAAEAALELGIRPEQAALSINGELPNTLKGMVAFVEHLGGTSLVHVRLEGGMLIAVRENGDATLAIGDAVAVHLAADHWHAFTADGRACRRTMQRDLSAGTPYPARQRRLSS
jgi:multiple sugar transport system ATP-binding protein